MGKIDVIVPCLNGELTIGRCLRSVIEQDYPDVEITVIDDGSTDRTAAIVEATSSTSPICIRLLRTENRGVSQARNLGLSVTDSPLVLFLDADDCLLPSALSTLSTVLHRSNADLAVGLAVDKSQEQLTPQSTDRLTRFSDPIACLIGAWWAVSCVLLRRSQLKWDEGLKVWEVIDYFLRHILAGGSVATCDAHVSVIDHSPREERVTRKYNHYDPELVFRSFRQFKRAINMNGRSNREISCELDRILLGAAYGIARHGQRVDVGDDINARELRYYDWYKPFGLTGFCRTFGMNAGIKLFADLNLMLGR